MVIEGMMDCPFCGGDNPQVAGRAVLVRKEIRTKYYSVCTDCLCKTDLFDTQEDAVKMWNTRRGKRWI